MQYRGLQEESKMQIKAVHMVTVNALPSNDMRLHGTFCKSSVLSVLLLARIIVLEAPPLPWVVFTTLLHLQLLLILGDGQAPSTRPMSQS